MITKLIVTSSKAAIIGGSIGGLLLLFIIIIILIKVKMNPSFLSPNLIMILHGSFFKIKEITMQCGILFLAVSCNGIVHILVNLVGHLYFMYKICILCTVCIQYTVEIVRVVWCYSELNHYLSMHWLFMWFYFQCGFFRRRHKVDQTQSPNWRLPKLRREYIFPYILLKFVSRNGCFGIKVITLFILLSMLY